MGFEPLLQLEHLSLRFPIMEKAVLEDINYTIYPGDFVVILGGNGSGKSSLLKLITGKYIPTTGKISWITQSSAAKHTVMLTQDPHQSLFTELTVLENALLWATRGQAVGLSMSTNAMRLQLQSQLHAFNPNLVHKLDTPCIRLSGGEKQSLLLALCLLQPLDVLLLDEHTSALDPKTAANIMQLTANTIIQRQITCLMTTHDLDDALQYGDRLIALKEGKIVFKADGEQKKQLAKNDLLQFCY